MAATAVLFELCVIILFSNGIYATYPRLTHTKGEPWPMPQVYQPISDQQIVNKETFRFVVGGVDCQMLRGAFRRYYKVIFYPGWEPEPTLDKTLRFKPREQKLRHRLNEVVQGSQELPSLVVNVKQPCELYPTLEMNEIYTMSITTGAAKLTSKTIWGALRGLETFSQLVYEADNDTLLINNTEIVDEPRFAHRGVMLDTSRHFLPKIAILQNLDAMAYNKLNVFHWHITDDESFPYESNRFPNLSLKGAYEPYTHVYTQQDIAEIIEYARVRGIRVIPEFDSPGHSRSWGEGQPDLLTKCYTNGTANGQYGPIDPSKESTYSFLTKLFTELHGVFKDHYLHLGGDEVNFNCWKSNPNITAFMKAKNITSYVDLESYYVNRLLDIMGQLQSGYVVWQEVFDNGCKVQPDTVVHVWKSFQDEMSKVTKMGLRAILSTPWYLNYISYGSDWKKYYMVEPLSFNGTEEQYGLVMGGELCMWGEYVDGTNVISRIWPRGSAVAERLWSPRDVNNTAEATGRLEEHRCRLIRRGLNAEPVSGPGYCKWEYVPKH